MGTKAGKKGIENGEYAVRRFGRRAILGGLAALPVVALAGCGGDDDEGASPEADTPTSAAGTRPPGSGSATQPPGQPSKTVTATARLYVPPPAGEWERADPAATG